MFLFNQTFVLTSCSWSDLNWGHAASDLAQDRAEAQSVVGSERQSEGEGRGRRVGWKEGGEGDREERQPNSCRTASRGYTIFQILEGL